MTDEPIDVGNMGSHDRSLVEKVVDWFNYSIRRRITIASWHVDLNNDDELVGVELAINRQAWERLYRVNPEVYQQTANRLKLELERIDRMDEDREAAERQGDRHG